MTNTVADFLFKSLKTAISILELNRQLHVADADFSLESAIFVKNGYMHSGAVKKIGNFIGKQIPFADSKFGQIRSPTAE